MFSGSKTWPWRATTASNGLSAVNPLVVVIGDTGGRLEGVGKMLPDVFLPVLERELTLKGISVLALARSAPLESGGEHFPPGTIILPVYNDDIADDHYYRHVSRVEENASRRGWTFLHPVSLARKLGMKPETQRLLSQTVRMPETTFGSHDRVFSNIPLGSTAETYVTRGSDCDPARYNTRFIDTSTEFRGKTYFVTLRIMAVGKYVASAFVRCRPTTDDSASVHDRDTPLEPDLLNRFHEIFVRAKMAEITDLSEKIGDRIGVGFYAHDVLPEKDTGQLYLCETGFKFHDWTMRDRLAPIAESLPFYRDSISDETIAVSARLFVKALSG
ncbi:MAG: hypothetical protein JSR99_00470 [Proteobacteria bacterium]|nr:hypothetical protein [Pseudomonadota bacterium]